MNVLRHVWRKSVEHVNNFKLSKKLLLFYCCCVMIPLFLTDGLVLRILLNEEHSRMQMEMANIAAAVQYDLEYTLDEAGITTGKLYIDPYMNSFFEKEYNSDLEYFKASYRIKEGNVTLFATENTNIIFYIDNNTITNGGHFFTMDYCREEEWYKEFMDSGRDMYFCYYYAGDKGMYSTAHRKISFIRKLHYYKDAKYDKIVKYDFDYNAMGRRIVNMKYTMPVYICEGDNIIFSSQGVTGYTNEFDKLTGNEDIGYEKEFDLYGQNVRILVMKPKDTIMAALIKNLPLLLLLLACNILLPALLVKLINQSFTERLRVLSQAFQLVQADSLAEIEDIQGSDEIGTLMQNYNRMVRKSQELIKTVYKDKLERQEVDIARQNAELLALHSQINPHFLFNVLESIRMHSVLKGEHETAEMIERLAAMERRNVEWSDDYIRVKDEMKFIYDYFELQKYRFGNRLSYELSVAPGCEDYYLPRLTLTTFTENACIHGVEKKSSICWVYVRVYKDEEWLYLEIEDTGTGISEEAVEELKERIRTGSIESLKEKKHIGMVNAYLRLKMVTNGAVAFELESEAGVGTFMMLKISLKSLTMERSELPC